VPKLTFRKPDVRRVSTAAARQEVSTFKPKLPGSVVET
jgi:hypothetical protein